MYHPDETRFTSTALSLLRYGLDSELNRLILDHTKKHQDGVALGSASEFIPTGFWMGTIATQ